MYYWKINKYNLPCYLDKLPTLLTGLLICILATGCVSHGELMNFGEGEFQNGAVPPAPAMVIQVDDLLSIKVKTLDASASLPFNAGEGNLNSSSSGGSRPIIGYLVDNEGNIDFPILGNIAVEGLTTNDLKEKIIAQLEEYLVNPVVNIRFINFRITLSGEIGSPGSYVMPNERVTILDALGLAGDITSYGNRSNILIVREQNGIREFGHVNLRDKSVFQSPYFYLRQNDYIYVEPLPEATARLSDQSRRILPWVSLVTSVVTLTIALTR